MEEFREMNPDLEEKKLKSLFNFPMKGRTFFRLWQFKDLKRISGFKEKASGRKRENRTRDLDRIQVRSQKDIPPGHELAWVRTNAGVRYLDIVPVEKIPIRKKIDAKGRSRHGISDSGNRQRRTIDERESCA